MVKLKADAEEAKTEMKDQHDSHDSIAKMFDIFLHDYSQGELSRLGSKIKDRLAEEKNTREENEARIEELVAKYVWTCIC